MRYRLAHTLSFWLLGAVALSVLATGGLTAWNLRQGFSAYLQARDMERFDLFVKLVESRFADRDAAPDAPMSGTDMPALLRELAVLDGVPARNQPPPPPPGAYGPLDFPQGNPTRAADERFGSRVALAWPDGRMRAGPPIYGTEPGVIERPIRVDGSVVALARMKPISRAPDSTETRFLRSQYLGIVAVTSALVLLALGCALWLARQWVRPLIAVQDAAARIAQGELGVRVPTQRGDEIGDLVRNINAMAENLQRIESARRRWLADLSHELRTPLTVLRGEIEALVDGVRPLDAAAVASLREDVQRLGTMVDELHLLAMTDLQPMPCHFADEDAVQIVDSALLHHEPLAATGGLTLQWAAKPDRHVPVRWDATRIGQLVANLLQNSLRYTDAPGTVEVALRVEQERVYLSVADSAPGVPEADHARVFEPLYRADAARGRSGGSGLGLAICAAIVQAHGGQITASGSPLGGLCIEVTLPIDAEKARA